MTGRRPLAREGDPLRPYSHLLPVLDVEASLGNAPRDEFRELPDGWWAVTMHRPLHLDQLRDAFDFPDHVELGRGDDGTTYLVDAANRCRIVAVSPTGKLGPAQPKRGLLTRVLGR